MKKMALLLLLPAVISCGGKETSQSASGQQVLKLSHNHAMGYPVDVAYRDFAKRIEEKSKGAFKVEIYPDAQLGDSRASVELAKSGVIHLAHINGAALEAFDDGFAVFNLPYIFKDDDHFVKVMNSDEVKKYFESTGDKGFITLMYLQSGARGFYTKNKPINTPEDLKGVKIRVQDSPTSIEMIKMLGGTPVTMNFGEVYTSLQQGVVDGAENNMPSFVQAGHAEVAKYFSESDHLRLADYLTMSSAFWNKLSEEEKQMFRDAANETSAQFEETWKVAEKAAFDDAVNKYNVAIATPDTTPFRIIVMPMHDAFSKKSPVLQKLIDHIRTLEK